jgi:hypothetical protein
MFCYVMMPFGLRNAGATYQRCMQHVFGDHIGRIVEAYVDNIVVKTRKLDVVWTSLGPLPRWVPGPTTRWAPGTTRLGSHDT